MKFLILEDDFSAAQVYKEVIYEVFDNPHVTICDNAPAACYEYMLHLHDVLLIDEMVNGSYTGIEFLELLKSHNVPQALRRICVSGSSSLKRYEGRLFDVYVGKNFLKLKDALIDFKATFCSKV